MEQRADRTGVAAGGESLERVRPVSERRQMRDFWVIWSGQTLSLVGSQAVQFSLIWWLTVETGSATMLTLAVGLGLLPQVVLGPMIGVLVDRWNRKMILFLSDAVVAVAALWLAVLFWTGEVQPLHILLLILVRALGGAFQQPTMLASTTLMVPERHFTRVQGLSQGVYGLMNVVAPPLGAFLVAILSMGYIMLVDVASAIVALVPLIFVVIPQPIRSAPNSSGRNPSGWGSFWGELVAGFRFLVQRRGHLLLVLIASAINLLLVPAFSLLPLLVQKDMGGGPETLAVLSAGFGIGMLIGGTVVGVWGGTDRKILTLLLGIAALGLAVLAVGLVPKTSSIPVFAAIFSVGFVAPFVNGPFQAILQSTIPPDHQGRIFSLVASLAGLTAPIGLALAGTTVEWVGLTHWYLAGGMVCLAMAVVGAISKDVRDVELSPPATQSCRDG